MTLDRLDRNDAMDVMKMFYELEEQVLIREDNIRTMRYYLRNYHPKKTKFGSAAYVLYFYLCNVFFTLSFLGIIVVLLAIYMSGLSENGMLIGAIGAALAVADIIIFLLAKNHLKKKKKEKFIEQNKGEYEYWTGSLNNDIKELNTLKPAIEDEYNKFNIAPEYRNAYAMQSLYDILSHRSTMSVADAMKKFDEDERARMVAAAHREAGAKVANAVAEEAEKTRMTLDANSRKEQEINNAILGRLNDFYFYR